MAALNRYSITAAVLVLGVAIALKPPVLAVLGLVALALAVHFWFWDPERKEVFADDWVEAGSSIASVGCASAGVVLLVIAAI